MTQVTYQKKLSRHFTRYAAVLVLLLFVAFTLILSVYTIGLNIYRNDRNNSLLSDSFRLTHKEYTGFLEDGNTRDLFQRRLQGDVSEQYLAYQYRQFSRAAHLPGMLILSDEQGDILYVSASTDTLSTHLKYFNKLIHHNLMQTPASYTTVYRFLNEVGKYVIAAPVPDKNGRMIGSAVIYIDDSSWEEIMRLNQFDGIITDESGHIIAASNRNMVENQTFFSDDDRLLYRHQASDLREHLSAAIGGMECCIARTPEFIDKHYLELSSLGVVYLCGSGSCYGGALEGALKLCETLQIPAIAYETEEYLHGPELQMTPNHTVFFLDDGGSASPRVRTLWESTRLVTRRCYLLSCGAGPLEEPDCLFLSHSGDSDASVLSFLPFFQILSYRMTEEKHLWHKHPLCAQLEGAVNGKSSNYVHKEVL